MKIYPNVDVDLTYQNFGDADWMCILRGNVEQIDSVFNAFFNFGATNGDYEFYDHAQTIAIFWSSRTALHKFFQNLYIFSHDSRHDETEAAIAYADAKILELRQNHETFRDFSHTYESITYSTGHISAERPDEDMKDAILANAYKDKSSDKEPVVSEA